MKTEGELQEPGHPSELSRAVQQLNAEPTKTLSASRPADSLKNPRNVTSD